MHILQHMNGVRKTPSPLPFYQQDPSQRTTHLGLFPSHDCEAARDLVTNLVDHRIQTVMSAPESPKNSVNLRKICWNRELSHLQLAGSWQVVFQSPSKDVARPSQQWSLHFWCSAKVPPEPANQEEVCVFTLKQASPSS